MGERNDMVYIVGIGPGAKEYILPKATSTLDSCEVVIGFERAIQSVEHKNKLEIKTLRETLEFLNNNKDKNIAIVASGDPCFYGITDYINKNFIAEIQVIPGISSFQYLMAKLNKCWQGAHLGSLHGRQEELLEVVKLNKLSIWLTDGENSPSSICKRLLQHNIKANCYVGVNLSYQDELIVMASLEEIAERDFEALAVVVIENKAVE